MARELGWTWDTGPGTYDYTLRSPKADQVIFKIGRDVVNINGTLWRQERDAVEIRGRDLLLPESTYNFICKHFGQHHLVRGPIRTSSLEYELDPIKPTNTPAAGPAKVATSTELKGLTIVVDAGHGGKDYGGIANGVNEKDVVLNVSLMLRDLCESAGAKVLMTRVSDVYPELQDRVDMANKAKADLFISIHANIAPNSDEVTGIEAFYNGNSAAAKQFTQTVIKHMARATDSPNRGAKVDPRGLRVLEKTSMPATLVELGFLSNAGEARRLTVTEYQRTMARALFDGIVEHWAARPSVSR